ncbi:hypothetical protein [Photobacterium iliopiscarium]|uniref:Uncharacterized protein n=2 Tax=Photobacterium iliopiscarium TaxID=56192 RepID=A0ABX5GLF4_9GAMM|nr:hypothetical protein [Photobacterium iliopiscarium]PSW87784.1 hypothetical protein C9J52_21020 [Photobacterium iliopiscarium]
MIHSSLTSQHAKTTHRLQQTRKWLNFVMCLIFITLFAFLLRLGFFSFAVFHAFQSLPIESFDIQQWQTDLAVLWQYSVIVQMGVYFVGCLYCIADIAIQLYMKKIMTLSNQAPLL